MIRNIVIVGGGTAGWMSAAYLSRALGADQPEGPTITVVESSDAPTIGVGEATVPLITKTLQYLGFDEREFMHAVSATFKQAIRFDDWLTIADQQRHSYYHAFGVPVGVGNEFIAPYWVNSHQEHQLSFVDYSMIEGRLCDNKRAPKRFEDQGFGGPFQYAYHFDAGQVAEYLKQQCLAWGVQHRVDHVLAVEQSEAGDIKSLALKSGLTLEGDFFVDCTGFAARLLGKKLASPWQDRSSILFCDTALAVQVPRDSAQEAIRPYTVATAKSNGWIWDIGLVDRRGIGYVYSSNHTSEDLAEKELLAFVGDQNGEFSARKLKLKIGYRPRSWVNNCVAIGLSAGFAEPLESTGIFMIELALARLVGLLPTNNDFDRAATRFNSMMSRTFESVFDFIKLHYCLSRRTDSEFWLDNVDPVSWPDSLKDNLLQWQTRTPELIDFPDVTDPFSAYSYHQILYGMECLPDLSKSQARYRRYADLARKNSQIVAQRAQRAIQVLPSHEEFIRRLHQA